MKIIIIAAVITCIIYKLTENRISRLQRKRRDELLNVSENKWTLQDEIRKGKK